MKSITKKLLIGVISLSLVVPVSFVPSHFVLNNIDIYAKARAHHHKKKHIRVRRRRRNIKRHHAYHAKHSNHKPANISKQMASRTLKDINKDRRSHGIALVGETKPLNRLANRRAHQLIHRFSHYDNHGQTYYRVDAKRMGISLTHYYHNYSTDGENIANAGLDHGDIASTSMPNDPHNYINHNGYNMADMDNDAMFHYDSGSGWGHRKNILNKHFRNIGIGVAHKGYQYFLAEDFDS